jgi:phosphoglycolate phosphatase-like HAD superfamily hydrolase
MLSLSASLGLSGSIGSLMGSARRGFEITPDTPAPRREDFKQLAGGVSVIFFDFDGTLTKTPGDRAVRATKLSELTERAPMLEQRFQALQEAGAVLGIISKSTEGTVRDCLEAAGLASLFQAPVIGKAVSFEGKVGIIADLVRKGTLGSLGASLFSWEDDLRHVMLVDDDPLELERCRARGVQAYAAAECGGLQEEDFDVIVAAVRRPPQKWGGSSLSSTRMTTRSGRADPYKWRTLILFSGDCFEG